MANIKDLYIVKIYYDDKNNFKIRPILIINKNIKKSEKLFTITEITSQEPKNPPSYYDNFKEPIIKWKKCGLDKMSYVKTNKLHVVKSDKLYKKIGQMADEDFIRIVERIIKEHNKNS